MEGAGESGGHTREGGGPPTGLQTAQLGYTTDSTMLTGEEQGGERAREKGTGAERENGDIVTGKARGEERKINEKQE